MLRKMVALHKNQEGATAIEFAVVAPVLFLLIFGIIEFGILFATQSALEGATNSAARTYKAQARDGNKGADAGTIHNLITQYSGGLVMPGSLRVVAKRLANWGTSSMPKNSKKNRGRTGGTGDIMQYRIYYDYEIKTPFLSKIMGGKRGVMALQASTVVQNEPSIGGGA
ncbi:MAG: pilus assembly protein [Alphaproteobacteria bacterium]|nr:pilus assembly protein [Alphaproteobacteria bacterium]